MSQRYQPHSRYPPRQSQFNPNRFGDERWNPREQRDDRRGSPRSYSPVRDRRESRDYGPRDIDTDRAQRHPREGGPGSAGSNISDPARFTNPPFRGGSSYTGRGRGRDWSEHGRPRNFGPEDRERDVFRPRSRSRPRDERDRSADSRDFPRREREDFRRDDDWQYRRNRPDDREFGRRDGPPRGDIRHPDIRPGEGSRGVSPIDRPRQPSPHRRPSPDLKRDFDTPRRQSTIGDLLPAIAARRELERVDSSNLRPDPSRERPAARPSDAETHSSVAVPQFGSIPLSVTVAPPKVPITPTSQTSKPPLLAKTSPDAAPTTSIPEPSKGSPLIPTATHSSEPSPLEANAPGSLVTEPSTEKQRNVLTTPIPSAPTSPMLAKLPPTAPRAQLGLVNPPTAPKADRIAERERVPSIQKDSYEPAAEDVQSREQFQSPRPPPTFSTTLFLPEQSMYDMPPGPRNIPVGSPVMHQRLAPPMAPTGPRGSGPPVLPRASSAGPLGRDASPTQTSNNASFGQRANSALINGLPSNVPTGPKADRAPRMPPTAPRMQQKLGGRPPTSLQWRANAQSVPSRAPMVPAKRDANGDEKERVQSSEKPTDFAGRGSSFSAEPRPETQANTFMVSRKLSITTDTDVQMTDAPAAPAARSPETLAFDTDDDDELEEDDFQEQAARFKTKKAELESQYTNLAEHWHRVAALIEESDRLRGILSIIIELPLPDHPPPQPEMALAETVDSPPEISHDDEPTPNEQLETPPKTKEEEKTPSDTHLASPDFSCLPYLAQRPLTPLSDPDHEIDASDEEVKSLLLQRLQEIETDQMGDQNNLRSQFAEHYRPWKRTTDEIQKVKDDAEANDAALLAEQNRMDVDPQEAPSEAPQYAAALLTPGAERRRNHTSAYDLDRVLEESRIAEEKRVAKQQREEQDRVASAEREATIPVMFSNEELALRIFKDTSLLRKAEDALRVFEYAPPVDTFTEEEDRQFRDEYDQGNTKMWHKIADAVGRTTKECINHYYATKWDQPYKRQKGKGGKPLKGRKKGQARRIETELTPQDTTIGLTETGRPRRAAAPTFSKNEKAKPEDGDTDTTTTKKGANSKTGDTAVGEEKVGRGRKPAKEKQPRKARGQPLASKAGPSPQKMAKEKLPKDKMPVPEPMILGGEMPMPPQQPSYNQERMMMPVLIPPQTAFVDSQIAVLHTKPDLAPPTVTLPTATIAASVTERPRSHSQSQRQGPSSYWSVPEEAEFKECLKYYGTDFTAIANHMGKKTPVMVGFHPQNLLALLLICQD
jgi:serine/arginine repetitive matrix protein 2